MIVSESGLGKFGSLTNDLEQGQEVFHEVVLVEIG
jgi:hypothetical protein